VTSVLLTERSRYRRRLDVNLTYSRAWFTDIQIQDLADRVAVTLTGLAT